MITQLRDWIFPPHNYEAKHWLCIAAGFWIDWPITAQTVWSHNSDGSSSEEKIISVRWQLSWKPPLLSERWRFVLLDRLHDRRTITSDVEELQALFDYQPLIEIDIS